VDCDLGLGNIYGLWMYSWTKYELYFVMFFLVFSVCEGCLGLSILVSIIRGFVNDYFQSCNVLQW
jgi:hypothetical protein